ncbi:MAG: glycoside hydrolase family 13 protein [Clostridia bacterium]|nr:glycoside hydrolase family 13 protein [Clostridia bacterium]
MNQPYNEQDALLSSIFSDGTALFREPAEPERWEHVAVRLRIQKGAEAKVTLLRGFPSEPALMSKYKTDDSFDWYEAKLYCRDTAVFYSFLVEWEGRYIYFDRMGPRWVSDVPSPDPVGSFTVIPGFHVPEWSKGAVQYQILADRFRNGSPKNDVVDREYYYAHAPIRHAASWDALPEPDDFHCHYGGDLVGVREKLDYLESLGVEAIYFNPLFVSPSAHKYDTQDYDHVDPHLTVIPSDGGAALEPNVRDNVKATKYIRRTTSIANLSASDEWFAEFCGELHRRGMKIILDGVFNHCGSFNRWLNREGVYDTDEGAYGNVKSPYRGYFAFEDERDYHSWWDVDTLPKLHYEQSSALCEAILQVAEKWARPPFSIDGWRLDVAADLGQTRQFNHLFWKEFRRRVKAVNPDLLIIAEHYGDPAEWLGGDEWDSVMNYDAFMDPLSFFLTGMEKHSDHRRDDLYQNGMAFFDMIFGAMAHLPTPSVYCAMDELSNHDHSRFMTRTNGCIGRLNTVGSAAATEGIRPEVFREAAVIQMTWPGAPTIYYGDEAGVAGWTDPDNRRTYPWGREDQGLIDMYRALAGLRRELPVLRLGSVKPLCAGYGYIAYARFDGESALAVVCNNTERPLTLDLPLRDIGVGDGTAIVTRFITTPDGCDTQTRIIGNVENGVLRWDAPGNSAAVLVPPEQ